MRVCVLDIRTEVLVLFLSKDLRSKLVSNLCPLLSKRWTEVCGRKGASWTEVWTEVLIVIGTPAGAGLWFVESQTRSVPDPAELGGSHRGRGGSTSVYG